MNEEEAKKIIDDVKRKYNLVSERFSNSRPELWGELDFLFDDYLKKGDKVLDLGCGNGRSYRKVASLGSYIGVDNSEELIEIAKRNYPEGSFLLADATDLPFDDESFDIVYAIGLLHHIPSEKFRMKVLKEISRTLLPEGLAVITVWDIWEKTARRKLVIRNLLSRTTLEPGDLLINWQGEDDFYFHCFTLSGLVRRCKRTGLNPIRYGKAPSKKGGINLFVVVKRKS